MLSLFLHSCGGNLLLNVGPTKDGRIIPIFEERLRQMGEWLKINGEAIYGSKPWTHQNDTLTKNIWYALHISFKWATNFVFLVEMHISVLLCRYTSQQHAVYAIVLDWPANNTLSLGAPVTTTKTTVNMLGYAGSFNWKPRTGGGIDIMIPPISPLQLPSQWVWTFELKNLKM